jgi:hypothetical protein
MAELGLLRTIAVESGDLELFPDRVLELYDAGKREQAREALLQAASREKDPARADRQRALARDPLPWAGPMRGAPTLFTLNGFGTRMYTGAQHETVLLPHGRVWTGVLWLTALFIPVLPLGAYLVTGSSPWRFHGRIPLPRSAWAVPAGWGGVFLLFFAFLVPFLWHAMTHTDVVVYNGFDEPIIVKIDEQGEVVAPHSHREWSDVPAGPARFEAFAEDGRPFESIDVDLTDHAQDDVVYNVASRGVLHLYWVRYGLGEPPEDQLLPPQPVHFLDADYVFTEPPEQKKVREGEHIDDQVLEAMEIGGALETYGALGAQGYTDHAAAVLEAEHKLHPQDDLLAYLHIQQRLARAPDDAAIAAIAAELRAQRDQKPEDVTSHRLYQDFGQVDREAVLQDYQARLAQAPESALAHYLVARLQDGEPALALYRAALVLDPDFRPALRGLGWEASEQGAYEEAFAALRRHGPQGLDVMAMDLAQHLAQIMDLPQAFPGPGPLQTTDLLALARGERTVESLLQAAEPEGRESLEGALYLVAGQLDQVRERMQDPGARVSLALKVALSDGATPADRELALTVLGAPEALPGAPPLEDMLLVWAFLARADPDRLDSWLERFRAEPAFAELMDRLGGAAGLRDAEVLDSKLAGGVPLSVRGALYIAGAHLHADDDAGPAFRERVRRFTLPLERPWLRP